MLQVYQRALSQGLLRADARQHEAVRLLAGLERRVVAYEPKLLSFRKEKGAAVHTLEELRKQKVEDEKLKVAEEALTQLIPPRKPRGLYLHGNVGTGKTAMMDMFYDSVQVENKLRVHQHDFMLDVHSRIHKFKHQERSKLAEPSSFDEGTNMSRWQAIPKVSESDGITHVGQQIARETTLLALDEFVVNDVVDALILKHLFGVLFREGTVVVATSNTAPSELYRDGLNYYYFEPFIPLLQSHCKTLDMNSLTDYRMRNGVSAEERRFLTPINEETSNKFEQTFQSLCDGQAVFPRTIQVAFGRKLVVEQASGTVCKFRFDDLCSDREPIMAAADYQALCSHFDTVMISDIPELGLENHNETRRFIILIDQLYDRGVDVVLQSEKPLLHMFGDSIAKSEQDNELFSLKEIAMASRRMISRLVEMTGAA